MVEKMKIKAMALKSSIVFTVLLMAVSVMGNLFFTEFLSQEKLKLMPIPQDYRNYFLLQSIDDDTHVIIGDFTGAEKLVSQIQDLKSDNQIDKVVEYFPDSGKYKIRKASSSSFVKNLKDLKADIISGKIFAENYAYKMKSLDTLKYKIKDGTDIFPYDFGHTVKFYDPDEPTTIMSEFFFSKRHGRYDLIFKTNYYKIYKMKIKPPVPFSVYCKNSKDPLIAETVEELYKMLAE